MKQKGKLIIADEVQVNKFKSNKTKMMTHLLINIVE